MLGAADTNWTPKGRDTHNSQRWSTRSFTEGLVICKELLDGEAQETQLDQTGRN